MKKRFLSYVLLAAAIILLGPGCTKVTDIKPEDRISSDVAFQTPARINAAVIGVYNALQSPEFLSGRSLVYSDVLGQDVVILGDYFSSIFRYRMLASDAYATNEWTAGFTAIQVANRVIEGIQANASIAGNLTNSYIGECRFGRALAMLTLVDHFAQPYNFTPTASHLGIPVITKSSVTYTSADLVPRNTVAEVYTQIISDLQFAEANIVPDQGDASVQRANNLAATALLARVYLYKGDYANAKIEAEKVISSGVYSLNANQSGAFGPGNYQSAESVFSISNNQNDNPNTNNALPMHYSPPPSGRGDLAASRTFLNLPGFAADDKRRALFVVVTGNTYTTKYADVATRGDWAPIIRYPEVLLTAAEASVRASNTVDAISLGRLNLVRDRSRVSAAQYTLADFSSAQSFIDAVLLERRIELAFEGHRIEDLGRTKQGVTGKQADDYSPLPDVAYGANQLVFPIPEHDTKLNPNLKQNPGY
jgi:hypothetical protein